MIMGLAATLDGWKPQLLDMLVPKRGHETAPVEVCLIDNRGVGRSSVPRKLQDYTTELMAADAKSVLVRSFLKL